MRTAILAVALMCSAVMGGVEFSATTDQDLTTVGGGLTYEGFSLGVETLLIREQPMNRHNQSLRDSFLGGYLTIPLVTLDENPVLPGLKLSAKAGGYWDLDDGGSMVRMYGGLVDCPIWEGVSFRVQVMQVNGTGKIDDTLATVGLAFGF